MSNLINSASKAGILKLEWDTDGILAFKKLNPNSYYFATAFKFNLSKEKAKDFVIKVRNCLRADSTMVMETIGKYDIDIEVKRGVSGKQILTVSAFRCSGQGSEYLGKESFDGYMLGKSLLEGFSKFISSLD